ncbi:hypothetical protein OAO39_01290 [Pirellulaceae bacterium]|jgi:hypothetical protein|nr:hypothetical protein [Pirellulaceae bacterium]
MSKAQFTRRLALCGLAANAVALPLTISGAIRNSDNRSFQSLDSDTVEFFAAKKAGLIDVMFIPRSSKSANIMMKNRTKRKLSIRMPEAFAGVPILGQMGGMGMGGGGMGMGGGGMGMGGGGGGQQGMGGGGGGMGMGGGGMGGGGMGMGGGGGMGGFQNIEPGRVRKVKVATVCLEHGKKEPNPRIKYDIVPIENFTRNAQVIELCRMLGSGKLDQMSAQAAAWHLTDDLSWQQLVQKIGATHLNGTSERYFHPNQVAMGMRYVQIAQQRAQLRSEAQDKEESLSSK